MPRRCRLVGFMPRCCRLVGLGLADGRLVGTGCLVAATGAAARRCRLELGSPLPACRRYASPMVAAGTGCLAIAAPQLSYGMLCCKHAYCTYIRTYVHTYIARAPYLPGSPKGQGPRRKEEKRLPNSSPAIGAMPGPLKPQRQRSATVRACRECCAWLLRELPRRLIMGAA